MKSGKAMVTFEVNNADGKRAIEVTGLILEQLYKSGLHRLINISWDNTKIFDKEGNLVSWVCR